MKAVLTIFVSIILVVVGVAVATRLLALTIPGATVTSWWRSFRKNESLPGSKSFSAHLLGWAVDLAPVTEEIENTARQRYPIVVNEGDHIHAAVFRA